MRFPSTAIAALAALSCGVEAARTSDNSENSNPPFFLTDFADGMCLSGAYYDLFFFVEVNLNR